MEALMGRERMLSRGGAEGRVFWRAVVVLAFLNLLLVAWVLVAPAGTRATAIVSNVGGVLVALLSLPLCFGSLADRPTLFAGQRRVPTLLGLGILTHALGQVVFAYYVIALDRPPPMPSLATIGFLGQYPFFLLAILLLPARPIPGAARARVALEG